MVIVALLIVGLLAIAAVAIDGGQAFSSRRSTQNAADAAALSGTEALNTIVLGGTADIHGAVASSLTGNSADASFTCELVDSTYATSRSALDIVSPTCPGSTNAAGLPANAWGVLVIPSQTKKTTFAQVVNVSQVKTGATAAAQIEKVTLTQGSAPFFACGLDASDGGTDPPLLIADATQTQTGGYRLNTAAIGTLASGPFYNVWGPHVPLCGGGNGRGGFHGLIGDDSFSLPSWIDDNNGVKAGPTRSFLAGPNGCKSAFVDGCHVLLPVCDSRRGNGNGTQLHCDLMAEFQLTHVGANSADAVLIGSSSILSWGTGSGGPPAPNDFRVIRLSV